MEAFGLLHFLQTLLSQGAVSAPQTPKSEPIQEPKKAETANPISEQAEQPSETQNAYLQFMAQHDNRAKRTKAKP